MRAICNEEYYHEWHEKCAFPAFELPLELRPTLSQILERWHTATDSLLPYNRAGSVTIRFTSVRAQLGERKRERGGFSRATR